VTMDESWFDDMIDHEQIWLPHSGKVPDGECVIVQSKNVMLTIMWSPTGFATVTARDRGCKFNAGYYVSEVRTPLSEPCGERGGGNFGNLAVHADNSRPLIGESPFPQRSSTSRIKHNDDCMVT
jgi:hypothetical protein